MPAVANRVAEMTKVHADVTRALQRTAQYMAKHANRKRRDVAFAVGL